MRKFTIVPALDFMDLFAMMKFIDKTKDLEEVVAYKVGFTALNWGLPQVVKSIRKYTDKPIIYDHQKGGTDVPHTALPFAQIMRKSGVDAAILFPFTGAFTMIYWIEELHKHNVEPMVGGLMTHDSFLKDSDFGGLGYISFDSVINIYLNAVNNGVTSFIIPLTKPGLVNRILQAVDFGPGAKFYAPGYCNQGGDVHKFSMMDELNVIIGRRIITAEDPAAEIKSIMESWKNVETPTVNG